MKYTIEITLPTISYSADVSGLAGYMQMVCTELTKQDTRVLINDYDFSDKVSIFRSMRRPSYNNRNDQTSNVTHVMRNTGLNPGYGSISSNTPGWDWFKQVSSIGSAITNTVNNISGTD